MLHFFIKSTICFTLLFAFYKLFLEREKMPRFNRFYLLAILVISLGIPNCNFNVESTSIVVVNSVTHSVINNLTIENFVSILLIIYIIGVIIFSARLIKNIFNIFKRIQNNPRKKELGFNLVLIEEKLLPHTFFNYVFVNRNDYETDLIQAELFSHEYVHASEKHSLDVIIVELFQIVFWFNPLVILFKRAVKLNHEFLADQAVITKYNTLNYQHILLDILSKPNISGLTSNLNYGLTKKRFKMMVKQSSRRTQMILKVALIPLILFSLFAFSDISASVENHGGEREKSSSWFQFGEEHHGEEHD